MVNSRYSATLIQPTAESKKTFAHRLRLNFRVDGKWPPLKLGDKDASSRDSSSSVRGMDVYFCGDVELDSLGIKKLRMKSVNAAR